MPKPPFGILKAPSFHSVFRYVSIEGLLEFIQENIVPSMLSNLTDLGILEGNEVQQIKEDIEPVIPAESASTKSVITPSTIPFVSTFLKVINVKPTSKDQLTVISNDITYYRLTPDYFAWLHHRMVLAQKKHQAGKITPNVYREITDRFNSILEIGFSIFSKVTLKDAVRSFNVKTYKLPVHHSPWIFPTTGSWNVTHPVSEAAVNMVKTIEERALTAGWTKARLYQNRGRFSFPCGEDYGLVCFLKNGQTIGEITERYIEIIGPPPNQSVLRFYNPDAEQPWKRKIEPEQEASMKKTTEQAA